MRFSADRQTLEDLNILGKYKANSIFSIFNQVKTSGAEKLLERMFMEPFSSPEQINARTSLFKYFQEKEFIFPLSHQQMGQMEAFLSAGSGQGYIATCLEIFRQSLLETTVKDERFEITRTGIQAVLEVIWICMGDPYLSTIPEVEMLAAKNTVKNFLGNAQEPIGLRRIARLEYLFRNELRDLLMALMDAVSHFDLYVAVTDVCRDRGFNYAQALEGPQNVFKANGIRHPGLSQAVANDIKLDVHQNLIFLTGANMAGKSTLMKTFGVNSYLAHMGFPVAAASLEFSVKSGIYTSINISDNLAMGYSHFYAEVLRVKQAAEQVSTGLPAYIIFDELFKGTNVKDAYDATLAVTKGFLEYKKCFFIISTHITEVGEALLENEGVQFRFMPTIIQNGKPKYTYSAEQGITSDRQGMMIIENEGILELLKEGVHLKN